MRTKVIATVLLVVGLSAAPAAAADEGPADGKDQGAVALLERQATTARELQRQIDLQLELAPGGKQTAPNEVSYDGGRFVVTYALPGAHVQAGPDCPSGWFCFYDGRLWGYPRGKLSDCGWQDLATYGWSDRTESLHNNTHHIIDYFNHWDFGNPANGHYYDYSLFYNPAHSWYGSVPSPNMADHVIRRC